MVKKLAVLALASAFALITVLPASALDREDKSPRGPRRGQAAEQRSTVQPDVKVFGHGDPGRLRFQRQSGPQSPADGNGLLKAECTFSCGDWDVTCSGSRASCSDEEGCVASGGGVILIVICL